MHRSYALRALGASLLLGACPGGGATTTETSSEGSSSSSDATRSSTDTPTTSGTTTEASSSSSSSGEASSTSRGSSSMTESTGSTGSTGSTTGVPSEVLIVPGFEAPESAFWSADEGAWFVSNIVGMPGVKDGDGYISKLSPDGSVDAMMWATGMDGPAGLRGASGKLYAADIDRIHEIDLATGMILQSVTIQGAMFLNDVAIGQGGVVYVSDTVTNTIHQWTPGKMPQVLVQDDALKAPNGLIVRADIVFCASVGSLTDPAVVGPLSRIQNKMAAQVGDYEGKLDGIEIDGMNGFLVTEFTGKLQRVGFDGVLVETVRDFVATDGLTSTADLGFDPMTRRVAIPDLFDGVVAFYTVP